MNQSDKDDDGPGECCMCGDSGIPNELYRCKVCRFRCQHRYCSNQYPKDGTYQVCNWCLASQMEDPRNSTRKAVAATQKSSESNSSQSKTTESDQDDGHTRRPRKSLSWKPAGLQGLEVFGKGGNGNGKVKKAAGQESSPEVSPTTTLRKRIITRGALEEKLRRTKSEEIGNRGGAVPRQVFRNKVRRYKLLEEVSS